MLPETFDLQTLRAAYAGGKCTPTALITALYPRLVAAGDIFLYLPPLDELLKRCSELESQPEAERGSLWGVPFGIKDNVDIVGMPTTAACPAFSYMPEKNGPAIAALLESGAIGVGKTNMDQFAAGLVGTRTPSATCPRSPFDSRFISGGSSSGSAAAVGSGLLTFALGTDTAGSGRVPAGLCGCVGVKPTVGSVSTVGVVPACASLDCLTVFTCNVADGVEVMRVMKSGCAGPGDVWRRPPPSSHTPSPITAPAAAVGAEEPEGFRFGVPSPEQLDWSGPGGAALAAACAAQFEAAIARLEAAGGRRVEVDFAPLMAVAAMLYGTSFVAERYSGIRAFLEKGQPFVAATAAEKTPGERQAAVASDERLLPVTRHIIAGSGKFTAADVYDHLAQMAVLRARALDELSRVDVLLVPTALTHWTVAEVVEEECAEPPTWSRNAKLGRFTNFVNLLDMCGMSVPSGLVSYDAAVLSEDASEAERSRAAHLAATGPTSVTLPFGVTLLTRAWRDEWLWSLAAKMEALAGLKCGPAGHGVTPPEVEVVIQ
ncbi:hypothetical protein VOLCADRAFT_98357 [Volvox carteri f. nagariensis]|uniref:Amidase domain-containing protein n=1 Tax=Volvox carteri f. nagariensis TaxID=3068 RepID=D8UF48_VOLCA|nr:uncharacterized protein VOLCADRAFT_98357 [Volvox carteri f. nagariensis]EFJ41617.1 hypothetical protein VOLCADRAFT_98357 [Volvox carteri f. nagariensis]|eukprot:XP_002957273.1 hypothetical protein VOLCADRAFT_98357 [Volvox carteri f. nagariensis]